MTPQEIGADQPLGDPVPGWTPPPRPDGKGLDGPRVRLVPLDAAAHAATLFASVRGHERLWTYLPVGPFESETAYAGWMAEASQGDDPLFLAICDPQTGRALGVASYLRIDPAAGSIEVGHLLFPPGLSGTPVATEAMYLMMRWAFEAGYRRYEWKCNALNRPSRRAAQRLGFSYEGVFRQARVDKGRSRDTAWFSVIDREWPALRAAFETWLDPANFDAQGLQRQALSTLTEPLLAASDPALR
jgi:RimJ/RimL family protein N-acetyltransferase